MKQRPAPIAVVLAVLAFVGQSGGPAAALDVGAWFKSLERPDVGGSCCDIADCHATDSDYRGTDWWAVVADKWTLVPPEKVLRRASIVEKAVVCNSDPANGPVLIYCFVPPLMGL